jgi:hypothetical protein
VKPEARYQRLTYVSTGASDDGNAAALSLAFAAVALRRYQSRVT